MSYGIHLLSEVCAFYRQRVASFKHFDLQQQEYYYYYCYYYYYNHNYNKILKSDWLPTALISALIGQINRTVRVMSN